MLPMTRIVLAIVSVDAVMGGEVVFAFELFCKVLRAYLAALFQRALPSGGTAATVFGGSCSDRVGKSGSIENTLSRLRRKGPIRLHQDPGKTQTRSDLAKFLKTHRLDDIGLST